MIHRRSRSSLAAALVAMALAAPTHIPRAPDPFREAPPIPPAPEPEPVPDDVKLSRAERRRQMRAAKRAKRSP